MFPFLSRNRNRREDEANSGIKVIGLKVDVSPKDPSVDEHGTPSILSGLNYTIRLFGFGFSENMLVVFTKQKGEYGGSCQIPATDVFSVSSW